MPKTFLRASNADEKLASLIQGLFTFSISALTYIFTISPRCTVPIKSNRFDTCCVLNQQASSANDLTQLEKLIQVNTFYLYGDIGCILSVSLRLFTLKRDETFLVYFLLMMMTMMTTTTTVTMMMTTTMMTTTMKMTIKYLLGLYL